jgi:hypothetical protein
VRLASLAEFRRIVYTSESAPSLATLRARLSSIPGGQRQGNRYYVDLDEFDRVHNVRSTLKDRRAKLEADPLLEGLI